MRTAGLLGLVECLLLGLNEHAGSFEHFDGGAAHFGGDFDLMGLGLAVLLGALAQVLSDVAGLFEGLAQLLGSGAVELGQLAQLFGAVAEDFGPFVVLFKQAAVFLAAQAQLFAQGALFLGAPPLFFRALPLPFGFAHAVIFRQGHPCPFRLL
jgi:hypothetical protein